MIEPTFTIRHEPRWQLLDPRADPAAWAANAAREAWARSGRKRRDVDDPARLAAGLADLVVSVRDSSTGSAYLFCPEPWKGLAAVMLVHVEPMPDLGDGEDLAAWLTAPFASFLTEPVDSGLLETEAGSAVRLRIRSRSEDAAAADDVNERMIYAWPNDAQGIFVMADTRFNDLEQADEWRDALDDFARGMAFSPGSRDDSTSSSGDVPSDAVTICPRTPDGWRGDSIPGGPQSQSRKLRIEVEAAGATPSARHLRWTNERSRTQAMPIGTAVPGALRQLAVVTTNPDSMTGSRVGRRLVFADGEGRALASSVPLSDIGFDRLWPGGIFVPLRSFGVEISALQVRDQRAVNRAFPGAAKHWYVYTAPWSLFFYLGIGLGLTAIALVLIGLL